MKILCIANESDQAKRAAFALRRTAPDVVVGWAGTLSGALRLVDVHRDFSAVIVEALVQNQSCASFVSQVRGLGVTVPVVVVSGRQAGPPQDALDAGANDYVESLDDLPKVVGRLLQTAPPPAEQPARPSAVPVGNPPPLCVMRVSFDGTILDVDTAALAAFSAESKVGVIGSSILGYVPEDQRQTVTRLLKNAKPHSQSAGIEFQINAADGRRRNLKMWTTPLANTQGTASVLCVFEDVTERDERERKLREREAQAQRLGEMARIAEAISDGARAEAASARETLDRRLAEIDATLEAAAQASAADRVAAADEASKRQAAFDARLAQEVAERDALARQLAAAESAREQAERAQQSREAEAAAAAEALAQREAELATVRAEVTAAREASAAARETHGRRVADIEAALDARIAQEVAERDALAQKLEAAEAAREQAGRTSQDREAEAAATAETLAQREAEIAAAAEALAQREVELAAARTEVTAARAASATARESFERRLAEMEAALETAAQASAAARQEAEEVPKRQAAFDARIAQEVAERDAVAQKLAAAESAREQAERRHKDREAEIAVTSDALAQREAELAAARTEASAASETFDRRLADMERALRDAQRALRDAAQRATADRVAAADQATMRQASFDVRMAQQIAARDALAQKLAAAESAAESARQQAERRHQDKEAEISAIAELLGRREAELAGARTDMTAARETSAAAREAFERRLAEMEAVLENAVQRAAADRRTAADEATARQKSFDISLQQEVAERDALARKLAASELSREQAERRQQEREAEIAVTVEALAQRGAELAAARTEATAGRETFAAVRAALERRLVEMESALENAVQRAAADRQAAAAEASTRQTAVDLRLQQHVGERDVLAERLTAAESAREQAVRTQQEREAAAAATAEALARREAELLAARTEATAAREAFERRAAEMQAALDGAVQRASADRQASADEVSARQAAFDARIAQEVAERNALAGKLAAAEALASQVTLVASRLGARQAQVDLELAHATKTSIALERRAAEAEKALEDAELHVSSEKESALQAVSEQRAEFEARLQQEVARFETLERDFAQSRAASNRIEREHSLLEKTLAEMQERARHLVMERDTLQGSVHANLEQIQRQERAQKEELDSALKTQERDRHAIEELQGELDTLRRDLEATRREREVLSIEANFVPQLKQRLEESRAEHRRQLEQIPCGMCRCRPDGALQQVNGALLTLLGYRTANELQAADFATAIFESADDLRWLIERCLASKTTESMETTWRRKDGGRLVVRLRAVATAPDAIDIIAEDATAVRTLEEKLRRAQRMEAVGRLASEVAVTCDNLLRDVDQGGRQWLTTIGGNPDLRRQGEQLLDEVTRAATFMRQLSVYGKREAGALEPVDLSKVLNDLGPVLKRVVGENIEFVLPKISAPVYVDVEPERVERVLVNVAAYGRERMPSGGQLTIDLATVVVNRRFVMKYPYVRPGTHALLTVTGASRTALKDRPAGVASAVSGVEHSGSAPVQPGVDLGALQALIGDCGGHLWLTADPSGDIVLKIHLPRRTSELPRGQTVEAKTTLAGRIRRLAGA